MKVKAIIFDLWETLGTKNVAVSKLLREKFNISKDEDYLRRYEEAVQLNQWETEEEMARSFLLKFQAEQTTENIKFVVEVFREAISKAMLFDGVRELLTSIKQKGFKIGLLSNTTIFEAAVLENLNIKSLFDAVVFSWQKGNLKPSRAAFDHILADLGVSAGEALFVDDTEKNIIAAKSYGVESIQFESVRELKQKLQTLKIL